MAKKSVLIRVTRGLSFKKNTMNIKNKLLIRKIRRAIVSDGTRHVRFGRFFGTFSLEVNREKIPLGDAPLPHPLRLLHLSDFHASAAVPLDFIARAVALAVQLQPDLICITGDYVTGPLLQGAPAVFTRYRNILRQLVQSAPTFSCFGNHDGYVWSPEQRRCHDNLLVEKLLQESGIRYFFNASTEVTIKGQPLRIAGLADLWGQAMAAEEALPPRNAGAELPVILLAHNPDAKDYLRDYQWDLMLSGHTHGGQFRLPFLGAPFAPVRDRQFSEGLHRWEGRWIHVTRGVGNVHGIRINCRPQLSLLTLL